MTGQILVFRRRARKWRLSTCFRGVKPPSRTCPLSFQGTCFAAGTPPGHGCFGTVLVILPCSTVLCCSTQQYIDPTSMRRFSGSGLRLEDTTHRCADVAVFSGTTAPKDDEEEAPQPGGVWWMYNPRLFAMHPGPVLPGTIAGRPFLKAHIHAGAAAAASESLRWRRVSTSTPPEQSQAGRSSNLSPPA